MSATATPWLVTLTVVLWGLASGLQSNLLGFAGLLCLCAAWAVHDA